MGGHGLSPLREKEHPVEELDGGAIDLPSILSAGYRIYKYVLSRFVINIF